MLFTNMIVALTLSELVVVILSAILIGVLIGVRSTRPIVN